MNTQERWKDPTGTLKKLADAFGFEEEKLQLIEGTYELRYTDASFDVGARLPLPDAADAKEKRLVDLDALLVELREKYGTALLLQLSSGGPRLELNSDYARAKLDKFFADHATDILTLEVRINKRVLARHWGLEHASANVKLFLYPEALVRALSLSLTEIARGENATPSSATPRGRRRS